MRCEVQHERSLVLDALGDMPGALAALRSWQRLTQERASLASRAHYQAAALQTELLMLQHKLDEKDAQRRATERARAELEAANRALSQKVDEVQALQEALRQQATRDELTGLFNRRHLNDTLPAMWALARRDGRPLAAVIIDLDHFKRVNDERGHDAGDRLLAGFGRLLASGLRKSDVACRYGGEEFLVFLPDCNLAEAHAKAETIRAAVAGTSMSIGDRVIPSVTISIGLAMFPAHAATRAQVIQAADAALYAAKAAGRNRVMVAGRH